LARESAALRQLRWSRANVLLDAKRHSGHGAAHESESGAAHDVEGQVRAHVDAGQANVGAGSLAIDLQVDVDPNVAGGEFTLNTEGGSLIKSARSE